jgi:hypothetical protein
MLWKWTWHRAGKIAAVIFNLAGLAACQTEDFALGTVHANRVIEYRTGTLTIQGNYTDDFNGSHVIQPTEWSVDYGGGPMLTSIVSHDSAQRMLVGDLGGGNYSRFDWALHLGAGDVEQSLYYCQSYPYVASADEAAALPRADATAPETGGCGGFTWSRLGPPTWPQFFHPEWALGPPGGTLDTVSLGYDKAALDPTALGGSLTLGLGAADDAGTRACVEDRPGDDFVVYENPFVTTNPDTGLEGFYTEVATVEVSADNSIWYRFPPGDDPGMDPVDPARYTGFAGVTPLALGGDR